MRKLAVGDLESALPAADRADEVGEMAKALLVFRDNAVEARRLAAVQDEAQAAKAARSQRLVSAAISGPARLYSRGGPRGRGPENCP